MQLKLYRYLTELRKNAIRFERIDINGKEDTGRLNKNFRKIICFCIALTITLLMKRGFSSNFVSYTSTVLSILIGLFISAIIFSFDKFHQAHFKSKKNLKIILNKEDGEDDQVTNSPDKTYNVVLEDSTQLSSKDIHWNTQSFNYAKQFAYLTGYSIVLSVLAITLLSFSTIFETRMNINIWHYRLSYTDITFKSVVIFLNVAFVIIQRLLVLYWIGGVIYYTLFIVSSMVNFMTVKMNRENDTN